VEINRDVTEYFRFPRDDYAWILIGSYLYIHGGYTYNEILSGMTNSMARVDLLSEPLHWEMIYESLTNPSIRDAFTMDRINDKIYLFGGLSDDFYLDELWEY